MYVFFVNSKRKRRFFPTRIWFALFDGIQSIRYIRNGLKYWASWCSVQQHIKFHFLVVPFNIFAYLLWSQPSYIAFYHSALERLPLAFDGYFFLVHSLARWVNRFDFFSTSIFFAPLCLILRWVILFNGTKWIPLWIAISWLFFLSIVYQEVHTTIDTIMTMMTFSLFKIFILFNGFIGIEFRLA